MSPYSDNCRSVINPNITVAAASIGSALSISKILKSLNTPILCFIGGLGDDDDGTYVTCTYWKFYCHPDHSTFVFILNLSLCTRPLLSCDKIFRDNCI